MCNTLKIIENSGSNMINCDIIHESEYCQKGIHRWYKIRWDGELQCFECGYQEHKCYLKENTYKRPDYPDEENF